MTGEHNDLRDEAVELMFRRVCRGDISVDTAGTVLLAAAAMMFALLPEDERRAMLDGAWAAMPGFVEHHAALYAAERERRGSIQ